MAQVFMGQSCVPQSFTFPEVFGAKVTNLEANLVTNYSADYFPGMYFSDSSTGARGLTFCNVSLEHTHPGYNDNIITQVWLPVENWNGRLQGSGGGGFAGGLTPVMMAGAVDEGYSCVSTDTGHFPDPFDVSHWALTSPGNVNWFLLQDFASVALNDAALIGKSITKDFYGQAPIKSYWNGCSTGGRQGLQLAQRYPTAYDGIWAAAPAINLAQFVVAEFWPQMIMYEANSYPSPCEFDAIVAAAIEACDPLDGVKDGIVSSPELCTYDPKPLIGQTVPCKPSGNTTISALAVQVAETAWAGARSPDGTPLWPGLNHEASLTGTTGLANTACTEPNTNCQPAPFPIPATWIKYFLKKDPEFDVTTIRVEEATRLFHLADQQYRSIISANDPDLSEFRRAGGKMITWHGLADEVIFPNATVEYYKAVRERDPAVADFYRLFEAPGAAHCWGGPGPNPGWSLGKLVEWVERGVAPESLPAVSLPDALGLRYERDLCPWPLKVKYKGTGDVRVAGSFECV